ncbi:hypothetical protein Tco_0720017 [Tanacetum coccineum]
MWREPKQEKRVNQVWFVGHCAAEGELALRVLGFSVLSFKDDKVLQEVSTSRFWFKEGYLVVKFDRFEQGFHQKVFFDLFVQGFSVRVLLSSRILSTSLLLRFVNDKVAAGGYREVKVLEFFDCPDPRQSVENLSEVFWAEDITMSTYLVNRSSSSSIGFKTPVDMLGFFGWLASIKQRMLEPVKVKYIFLGYGKEDINEAAFAVAVVDKIYAHELLTFNNTVACEMIFKWEARLKDDMDVRSDVYVLSNGCKKCSDDNDGYYWEYTPAKGNILGLKIIRDQSGNTLRVSQSRIYNEKMVSGYRIYAVGSHEYQMVCTRPDIASAGKSWLKGLLTESRYELRLVAGIVTGAWVKGCSHSEVPAHVKVAAYRY